MRFLSGVVMGVALTFGTAFVVDTMHGAPGPDGREARRLVNWDVVGDDLRVASTGAQDLWARLVGGAKRIDRQVEKPNG